MSGMADREKDFENKHAYEEKMNFKIAARTAKLMGVWAAEKLGLTGEAVQEYAMDVVGAKLEGKEFEGVIAKLTKDFAAKNVDVSAHALATQLEETNEEAREQILKEGV